MSSSREKHPLRERDFVGILEDTGELVTVIDEDANLLWVNPVSMEVFGVGRDEYVGRSAFDFIHVEDPEATRRAFQVWVNTPGTHSFSFQNRQIAKDGTVHHLHWVVTRRENEDGEFLHLASTAHDISDIYAREEQLARSEARMRALFRGTLDALVVIDIHGRIIDASESVLDIFGWKPDELVGQNVKILMTEPHYSQHDEYLRRYRQTGNTWILDTTREFTVARKDGTEATCELSVSRVDVPGDKALFLGSFRDVTERHRAVRELRQSEARFRAVFEQEYQFIGLLQPDGTLLLTNRAALDIANVTLDDVIGISLWDGPWFDQCKDQVPGVRAAIERAAQGEVVRQEIEICTADGDIRTVDFSVKPLVAEDGTVQLLIPEGRDITMLKRAQERETGMLRALAAIGQSASILAHEIKNPITAVNLALQAVADKLGEDQRVIIEDLLKRMKKLENTMRRTLSFAKPLNLELQEARILFLFREVRTLLEPELDAHETKLVIEPLDSELTACVDRGLIEELLINLVRNAMEALEHGGTIKLRARACDNSVLVEVEDDGPGIPKRLQEELFEPFQTTKEMGTGLGLAFSRKVAEEHGGTLDCVKGRESGALFRLSLPRDCDGGA